MITKPKVCPVIEERCHYLTCLQSAGCVREDESLAPPPFVRASTREPSLKGVKRG